MRITTRLFFLIFMSGSVYPLSAQQTAGEYLNAIGVEFSKIADDLMSYTSAVNHGKSARKIDKRRSELINQVKTSEATVRRMKPFNGSSTLRDSISAYFKLSFTILTYDYEKIIDLEEIAEQSYDAMEAFMLANEKVNEKVHNSYLVARREYEAFATANDIKLIQNSSELSEKLKNAELVDDYSDKLYLLFFKSYKNESYMLDAMNKGDMAAMEQARNALEVSATDDLEKVQPIQPFKGDNTLKHAGQQLLLFYKSEAAEKMPKIVDFYLKKENFEKMQKAMESKKQKTQEDIDKFNATVKDYNASVVTANNITTELNKKRTTLLKAWGDAQNNFLDKHTPKYK
jgi:hypothetical protein